MQVATAAARLVVTKILPAVTMASPSMLTVEQPLKPNQQNQRMKTAESADGQVVAGDGFGFAVLVVFSDTGTEDQCADAGGDAADHMYGRGSGEIMEAKL